jgi:hypothetical protein
VAPRIGVKVSASPPDRSVLQRVATSRSIVSLFGVFLVSVVVTAMAHNMLLVRDLDGRVEERLLQRVLVQPVHLFWLTWQRLQQNELNNELDSRSEAARFMFDTPFDAKRNTGVQYLMFLHLGPERASQIYEDYGVDYAGGYPEILIELGGLGFALAIALVASFLLAALYRTSVVAVCRGHFLTSLLAIYVGFGLINLFLGGMLNFVMAEWYLAKVLVFFFVLALERLLDLHGKRLVPWVFIRRPIFSMAQSSRGVGGPGGSGTDVGWRRTF